MKKNLISIIIVHYQVEDVLFSCLKSIFNQASKYIYEVIVVDNGSHDGFEKRLSKHFSKVKYSKSPKNLGFGAGNNVGASLASGNFLFFLNSDTQLQPGCLDRLADFLRAHTQVGIVAPTLLHSNKQHFNQQGSLTLTPLRVLAAHSILHRVWPNNPISKEFWLSSVSQAHDRKVEVVPGTAFMISKDDFTAVSGFDESFFLYFEEYDICRRVLSLNKEIWMLGEATIIHLWEASTKSQKTDKIYTESLKKYLIKYYGNIIGTSTYLASQISGIKSLIVCLLILLTIMTFLLYS